jgi:hypothetical protein
MMCKEPERFMNEDGKGKKKQSQKNHGILRLRKPDEQIIQHQTQAKKQVAF